MPERFAFEGTVETWSGVFDGEFEGYVPDELQDRQCARCEEDAVSTTRVRAEWQHYLREEADFYTAGGTVLIPLCPRCKIRFDALEDGEKESGYYDDETRGELIEERERILDDLDTNALRIEGF